MPMKVPLRIPILVASVRFVANLDEISNVYDGKQDAIEQTSPPLSSGRERR